MGYDPEKDLKLTALSNIGDARRCSARRSASSTSRPTGSTRSATSPSSARRTTGLHIFEDAFIIQIVDPETGEPVPDGELGSVCLTEVCKTG